MVVELAVQCGEIPARLEVDDDGYLPGTDFIGRHDYLAWRNLQSDPPARSRIRIWQAPAPVEFFATAPSVSEGTTAIPDQQHIVESPEPEPDELLDRPRTRNAHPVGLTGDYLDWKRLDTHPEPDSLEWQARDGRLRVAIKAHCLRAYLVPGTPAPGRSDFDEYTSVFGRDGAPPKGSPLLLIEGYWYLGGQEAFYVLRDGVSRNVNWLYPPDPAELHRLWPDFFPDGEFYLDRERWKPVRREDLFWFDARSQPATDPVEPVPSPAVPQGAAIAPAATEPRESAPAATVPNAGTAKTCKRKRVDQLGEAIEAALAVLSPDGRLLPPARLFEYLKSKDTTGVIEDHKDDALLWTDANGKHQRTTVKNLADRLSRRK